MNEQNTDVKSLAHTKVQFTRDYTGQVSDGRGSARQIFHVIFKLSLVAAMVVIIKSTTRRLSSKDTFSQVSRQPEIWLTCSGLMASTVSSAILARSSCLRPSSSAIFTFTQESRTLFAPVRLSTSFSISLSTWRSSTCRAAIFGFAFAAFFLPVSVLQLASFFTIC